MTDAHILTDPAGTISIAPGVLEHVVAAAAERVDGARVRRPRRGLTVSVHDGAATVRLELAVRFGDVLPEVAGRVQRSVSEALESMCGLRPEAVDVEVAELDE